MAIYNVKSAPYNAAGDAQMATDAVVTSGSHIVTSATANFQGSAVGKAVWVNEFGTGNTILAPTTITSVDSSSQIYVTGTGVSSGTGALTWGTDDTAAFEGAFNDAIAAQSLTLSLQSGGVIYAPSGAYMIASRWYNNLSAYQSGKSNAPSVKGDGKLETVFVISPSIPIPGDGTGIFMQVVGSRADFTGFTIHGGYKLFATVFDQDMWRITQANSINVRSVNILGMGGSSASAAIAVRGTGHSTFEDMYVVNYVVLPANVMTAMNFVGSHTCRIRDCLPSNWYANLVVQGNDMRSPITGPIVFEGYGIDEGGFACLVVNGGNLKLVGSYVFSGLADTDLAAVVVDGTSKLWIENSTLGRFGSPAPGTAIRIDAGGVCYASMTTFRGDISGASRFVINNGKFVDCGGNDYRVYSDYTTYTTKTPEECFSGHPPNVNGSYSPFNQRP
jgi:hypothetical protein